MEYNKTTIGDRIKNKRIEFGYKNQGDFAKAMGLSQYSRQTISGWEHGNPIPTLNDLIKMCDVFSCELGYLLGEFNSPTRELTDIKESTGLTENAISVFKKIKSYEFNDIINTLNQIIEHKEFMDFLSAIHLHKMNFNKNMLRIDTSENIILSKSLNCSIDDTKKYLEASSISLLKSQFVKIIESL